MRKPKVKRWLLFLIGGGTNTVITYGIYLALNQVLSYQWAYLLAYVLGVVLSYWINAVLVFKVPLSWKGLFAFPLVYVIQYVLSAVLLGVFVEAAIASVNIAPLLVIVITLPVTYAVSRSVLAWSNKSKPVDVGDVELDANSKNDG